MAGQHRSPFPQAIVVVCYGAILLAACVPGKRDNTKPVPDTGLKVDTGGADGGGEADGTDAGNNADSAALDSASGDAAVADAGAADVPPSQLPGGCTDDKNCDYLEALVPCIIATCAKATGVCEPKNKSGGTCDDGNPCTLDDTCKAGQCGGIEKDCDDSNQCTDDVCLPASGCQHTDNTSPCDHDDPCVLVAVCKASECTTVAMRDCTSIEPCKIGKCNKSGECINAPDDSQEGDKCDDGNPCTDTDTCQSSICKGKTANCDDGNACTKDTCAGGVGCVHFELGGVVADCGGNCSTGTCTDGKCKMGGDKCDDKDACTKDSCDPAKAGDDACNHITLTGNEPCDDEDACTSKSGCFQGTCNPQENLVCADGNACTDDSCDKKTGCVFAASKSACNDGNGCTEQDVCKDGKCQGLNAKDGKACGGSKTCKAGNCGTGG